MAVAAGTVATTPSRMMTKPSFPESFVRWSSWSPSPPGQGALHVQHFLVARGVGRNCNCGGRLHVRGCSGQ
eukprot:8648854-Alexandrium_andersonii.AAC.1